MNEQALSAAERLTAVLARTVGAVEHPSGLCRVTATATGELRDVRLHPALLQRGSDAVGELVVATARLATDSAIQKSFNELAKALGDGMAMAVEAFAGPPPLHQHLVTDPAPPVSSTPQARATRPRRPPAPPEEDEDDFFADPFRGQRR
ncbi:YbaB/EbfC family nucleoid-associated protein [Actinosynnema sp. NPDC020468]|uniref:YbaB/EbfC family nucleoid-associated protein n=1 Tax=Actinosynnema sp. NPDC020468 TaxID=3154488 RepID=UPI0033E143ED